MITLLVYITYSYVYEKHTSCTYTENDSTLMGSIYIQVFNFHDDFWMNIIFAYKTCILYYFCFKRKITIRASYSSILYQYSCKCEWEINMTG